MPVLTRALLQVDARSYESSQVLIGHEHFVACAVQLPASPAHPSGAIASGGYDRTMSGQTIVKPVINIWEAGAIVATLEGHTLTVCGIAVTPSGHMVSVSWDKTARVWDLATRQCVTVMMGHEQAVWAVLCLEDGRMLTASADKTIKRWNGATCEHTYVGHSDCVRALAMMPGIGFLSTGNDCSIRMWAVSGECLMTMSGESPPEPPWQQGQRLRLPVGLALGSGGFCRQRSPATANPPKHHIMLTRYSRVTDALLTRY